MKSNQLVKVIWHDAEDSSLTWGEKESFNEWGSKPLVVESYGFIIYKNKYNLVMAGDKTCEGDYARVQKIPIRMVKAIKYLSQRKE